MTNWVDHRLTITGPETERERFANCLVKAKEGDLFPQYYSDRFCDGKPLARPVGELYFSFDNLVPRPQDSDQWVLARWCITWVACNAKIELTPGEINLEWLSGYAPALQVYAELAELFPRLKMRGDYCELMNCIGGDVFCFGGKFTHVDKSKLIEAEMDAFHAEREQEPAQEPPLTPPETADEIPF
jgi:hypothetical protein